MDRIKTVAYLTPPQCDTWGAVKELWDDTRRTGHITHWGRIFAEEIKQILTDLQNGAGMALSHWMESERRRTLADEKCLMIPAIEFV